MRGRNGKPAPAYFHNEYRTWEFSSGLSISGDLYFAIALYAAYGGMFHPLHLSEDVEEVLKRELSAGVGSFEVFAGCFGL
jgi:hypothetical protein